MAETGYQGIVFPDRAENLAESIFKTYRVFLDHWDSLATTVRFHYETMSLRRQTTALLVYGPQGSGKTLFARRLHDDFKVAKNNPEMSDTSENLWNRVTGGTHLSDDLIKRATLNTDILLIEDNKTWAKNATEWREKNQDRHCIIIADNSERTYFIQGLLDLSDADYLSLGKSSEALNLAAQRFVRLCRETFRGAMLLLFTNDPVFSIGLEEEINKQHEGLLKIEQLPLPSNKDKETIIRSNVNRLNRVSYWYCIDKAGPEAKVTVYEAIKSTATYPASFKAVDDALKSATASRVGRPASKCMLTLVLLTPLDDTRKLDLSKFGDKRQDDYMNARLSTVTFYDDWCTLLHSDKRQASLVVSEWNLRIIVLGEAVVKCLLGQKQHRDYFQDLMDHLLVVHTPGTWTTTRDAYWETLSQKVAALPDSNASTKPFWERDQARSTVYEDYLRALFPSYNTNSAGFLRYRPDLILEAYTPCSLLSSVDNTTQAINIAIRRTARAVEFTASKEASQDYIIGYLSKKIGNYVQILEEQ